MIQLGERPKTISPLLAVGVHLKKLIIQLIQLSLYRNRRKTEDYLTLVGCRHH